MLICSDPAEDTPPTGNNGGKVTREEADKFLDRLKFASSTKVTGTPPTVVNPLPIKTDCKDTIYVLEALKLPIRISHPSSEDLGGIFIAAENSSFYYDVPIDEVEESDTVSVVVIEVEPGDQTDMVLRIVAYSPSKLTLGLLERVIHVEKPSSNCDLLIEGDTADLKEVNWIWHSTLILDENESPVFMNSHHRVDTAYQQPSGCCGTSPACPEYKQNPVTGQVQWVYDSYVSAVTTYSIAYEGFSFYKNGTFTRISIELIKNFNPQKTDWCARKPGYNERETIVEYRGTHNYQPGKTSISYVTKNTICDDPLKLCGFGSRPGAITQSCHLLIISASVGAGEGKKRKEVRIYVRRQHLDKYAQHQFYS